MTQAPIAYNLRMTADRQRLWMIAKTIFGLAVIVFVARHFARTLAKPELDIAWSSFRLSDLLPAGLLYLLCHTLWGTFWWQLLRDEDQIVRWRKAVSTYFVSQFGKYIPGKAWVIVIRATMLSRVGCARRAVVVTGIFETLTSMASGALIGVACLPAAGLELPPGAGTLTLFALVAGVPIGLALLAKLAQHIVNTRKGPDAPTLHAPSIRLLARGLLQASLGWCLLAVSLQMVIAAVRGDSFELTRQTFLANLAAVTLSYVAGFVIFVSPGGLGVREWVLAMLIAARWPGDSGQAQAVVVALLVRLVWTAAEVLLALSLWFIMFNGQRSSADPRPHHAHPAGKLHESPGS